MDRSAFTVGWVCALDCEFSAAYMMLDTVYADKDLNFPPREAADTNCYILGSIGGHNVVIACLPGGVYGTASAASVGKEMKKTFPSITTGLMVGIGGGFPSATNDVRLGDVVVSYPVGVYGGVVQYDLGKVLSGHVFQRKGVLNKPPTEFLTALQKIKVMQTAHGSQIPQSLEQGFQEFPLLRAVHSRPDVDDGQLCRQDHSRGLSREQCKDCSKRLEGTPFIHYGLIASGNSVIASVEERDKLQAMFTAPILCFEMEAAGLMDTFPCIVVRGISDLADVEKGDNWHGYAAAVASAYAKELLGNITPTALKESVQRRVDASHLAILQLLSSSYLNDKNSVRVRVEGTCEWFFQDKVFLDWRDCDKAALLWMTAGPGYGKSVLSRSLIDQNYLNPSGSSHVCYFFFKDGIKNRTDGTHALASILHQLFSGREKNLIEAAVPAHEKHGTHLANHLEELWSILLECSEKSKGHVICILDGFDECEDNARSALQELLSSFYAKCCDGESQDAIRLKFLITSRPYDNINFHFSTILQLGTCINLDGTSYVEEVASDINLVIKSEIPRILQHVSEDTHHLVIQKLKSVEHRTYLWLFLTLDILRQGLTRFIYPKDFDEILDSLPSDIMDAYGNILGRIKNVSRARKVFNIVLAAERTLTLPEMNVALAISEHPWPIPARGLQLVPLNSLKRVLENICGLFIQVIDSRIYLIHQTARGYLLNCEKSTTDPWRGTFDDHEAHGLLCELSLKQLLIPCKPYWRTYPPELIKARLTDPVHGLYEYAASRWSMHLTRSERVRHSFLDLVILLLCDIRETYDSSGERTKAISEYLRKDLTPFSSAVTYKLDDVFSCLLKMLLSQSDLRSPVEKLISQMITSWTGGHLHHQERSILETFIDQLAQTELSQYFLDLALYSALASGHDEAAHISLRRGARMSTWTLSFAHALCYLPESSSQGPTNSLIYKVFIDHISNPWRYEMLQHFLYPTTTGIARLNNNVDHEMRRYLPPTSESQLHVQLGGLTQKHSRSYNAWIDVHANSSDQSNLGSLTIIPNPYLPKSKFRYPAYHWWRDSMEENFQVSWRGYLHNSEYEWLSNELPEFRETTSSDRGRSREIDLHIPISQDRCLKAIFPHEQKAALEIAIRYGWSEIAEKLLCSDLVVTSMETSTYAFALAILYCQNHIVERIVSLTPGFSIHAVVENLELLTKNAALEHVTRHVLKFPPIPVEILQVLFVFCSARNDRSVAEEVLDKAGSQAHMIVFKAYVDLIEQQEREYEEPSLEFDTNSDLPGIDIARRLLKYFSHENPTDILPLAYRDNNVSLFKSSAKMLSTVKPAIQIIQSEYRRLRTSENVLTAACMLQAIGAEKEQLARAGFDEFVQDIPVEDITEYNVSTLSDSWFIRSAMLRVALGGVASSVVEYLVSLNFGPMVPSHELLLRFFQMGNTQMTQALVRSGVNPDHISGELANSHVQYSQVQDLRQSYQEGLGSDLCALSFHGQAGMVQELLKYKNVTVNATSGPFGNALCAASYMGHYDVVSLLLLKGADVHLPGRTGTPLEYALRDQGKLEIPEMYRVQEGLDNSMVVLILRRYQSTACSASSTEHYMDEQDFHDSDEIEDWENDSEDGEALRLE
ncbi:hypothetical protein FH972_025465 [Carpinus fangiana]|uniref:Nephrocystin 3-like N-terminal domain-containing protein n=1 Tax=Carpinus fangiana TaxID=176857 RepID=A0A5N6L1Q2_9ROSI|nr:hypothetical protein FH972_025465 [Carpinus fangiana]